ncbi:hypothetical protein VTN02DRAFT_1537 [Thermoascus thermophilus]
MDRRRNRLHPNLSHVQPPDVGTLMPCPPIPGDIQTGVGRRARTRERGPGNSAGLGAQRLARAPPTTA